ncbi:Arsenical resistance operon repressor [Corynebacterium choanae]|uniref:Arsenical resistance operon repressor n=2 Tax=Corynebacterium choanae TaxID=1862358 RepID=A0A3G6J9L0_9CORY|nr:Arsenical resistance operon repressor [Corynebacterium choanae]
MPHEPRTVAATNQLGPNPACRIEDIGDHAVEMFKTLGDPTRLQLLYTIAAAADTGICSHGLAESLNITAPTVTHHMKKLINVGLVHREPRGKWAYYTVNTEDFQRIHNLIAQI